MRILVTGGAGFIGSHLVDLLIKGGHKVFVLDDLSTGDINNLNPNIIFKKASINDDLEDFFKHWKFDYVFHLAAQANLRKSIEFPKEDAKINIHGSMNIIENSIKFGVKKIIFSSTAAIYSPDVEIPCRENDKLNPQSPYGLAKLTIEKFLEIQRRIKGLNYAILRYANVYGPRQNSKGEAGVVSVFFDKILSGEPITIFGDGAQTRDFIYVKDIAMANIFAMERDLQGIYNVSSSTELSILELANKLKNINGNHAPLKFSNPINGELNRSCLDNSLLLMKGWMPKYSLEEGLKETAEYFNKIKVS